MKRVAYIKTVALLLCMCCIMAGCSSMDSPDKVNAGSKDNPVSGGMIGWTDEGLLTAKSISDDKSITIEASVIAYPPENVYRVNLVRDESEASELANELIMSRYTDYQESLWDWSVIRNNTLVAAFGCDDLWTTNYIDVENDQDGITLEEDQLLKNFITEKIPAGSIHTPTSAIKIACDFINEHSEALEFKAYNVMATEDEDSEAGFYTVEVEGYYKGIPVSRHWDLTKRSAGGSIHVGNNGIFNVCAMFLLKETSAENATIVDVEQVAATLCNHFHMLISMYDIQIDEISLEYFFWTNDDGTYTLKPVWCFSGSGQQTGLDHRSDVSILYFAEDGSFCGIY